MVPLGWPGLGWTEQHLYAYYIPLTTYYLITWDWRELRTDQGVVGNTQAQLWFRDLVYDGRGHRADALKGGLRRQCVEGLRKLPHNARKEAEDAKYWRGR